ncbi:hypothetical protein ACWKWN_02490 [Microbacterium trichothecenolyticum]
MSTTGNEYEQPGVNYPDREDAAGAASTPAPGEPAREDSPEPAPTMGEPAPDAQDAPAWNEGTAAAERDPAREGDVEPAAPAAPAPSHEAVGIGVVDDGIDHHGQDGARETQTASEAQRTPGGLGPEQEQRLPAMAQNNASDIDKVAGIVAQTRQDVGTQPLEEVAHVLRQRLTQSGIELPENDIDELARQVSVGDTDDPARPRRGPAG